MESDFGLATTHQNRSLLPDLKALQLESSNPQHAKSPTHTMEVGTSLYMSPEQEDNGKYDHKVDIGYLLYGYDLKREFFFKRSKIFF